MSNGTPSPLAIPAPGTSVPSGSLVTPSGSIGPTGPGGPAGPTAVSTDAGNIATLGSDSLILVPQSQIWSVRLRSFNAIGNPNFEVDQRNCGTSVTLVSSGSPVTTFGGDRWSVGKNVVNASAGVRDVTGLANTVPGTSFYISQNALRLVPGATQATLAAGEYFFISQTVEGPMARELWGDVSSVSVLFQNVYSGAAVTGALSLRDNGNAHSIVSPLFTLPASAVTLVTWPNVPAMAGNAASGNLGPGVAAYSLNICLGCGSTYIAASTNQWLTGNYLAPAGIGNFLSVAANQLNVLFVQHEPGAVCTTLMDKPFAQNYDECLRYYQKTYPYATIPGSTVTFGQYVYWATNPVTTQLLPVRFIKPMAKAPTVAAYSVFSGAINTVRDYTAAVDRAVMSYFNPGDAGFAGFGLGTTPAANANIQFHYTADTGW